MGEKVSATTMEPLRRVLIVLGVALAVVLLLAASAFQRAMRLNRTLQSERATLVPMLTAQAQEQATLAFELTRVQSDAYVEEWARRHGGMVQQGEVLVIPLPPTATPTPIPTPRPTLLPSPTATPTPLPFWERWWRTLTGKP